MRGKIKNSGTGNNSILQESLERGKTLNITENIRGRSKGIWGMIGFREPRPAYAFPSLSKTINSNITEKMPRNMGKKEERVQVPFE